MKRVAKAESDAPRTARPTRNERVADVTALPPGFIYLTKPQMAGILQVSVRCVWEMMQRGELPFFRLRGRFIRFRLEEVHQRLKETSFVCNGAPVLPDGHGAGAPTEGKP